MTRRITGKFALPVVGLMFVGAAGCTVAQASETTKHPTPYTDAPTAAAPSVPGAVDTTSMPGMTMPAQGTASTGTATAPAPAAGPPGSVAVAGSPVKNLIEAAEAPEKSAFCAASKLPAGEGQGNKGGTCVSTPLGEIAAHPVRVATNVPFVNRVNKPVKVKILVADNQGPIDLNAFTHDANNKAGITLHEFPGQLDANGRPFIHCHLGIAKVAQVGALPGEFYDGAFSGVQGFKGKGIVATVTGLPRGSYRADVYCSVPGHAPLPTALANMVQAFDTADFVVVGRNGR